MLEILIVLVAIAAALQPTPERKITGLVFAGAAIIHYIIFFFVEGWSYYFSAALFDAFVIFVTLRMRIISHVIESIHAICYISILMNFFGWALWMAYFPPDAYNMAFIGIYAWSLITLLRKEVSNGGDAKVGMGYPYLLASSGKSHHSNTE